MKFLPVLLLLLACAAEPVSGPEATCQREAARHPDVLRLSNIALGNPDRAMEVAEERRNIEARATRDCLARAGLRPAGGGVEPVSRERSIFQGIR